ncbi:MAG: rhodanese-like domain-containing protein [Acidimicrobiales bacterium]
MVEVSPDEAAELLKAGALLLDVREPEEWEAGHVAGARFIPMGEVQARVAELPSDRRIVVMCRAGHRSVIVTEALAGAGIDAVNLAGGISAWSAGDRPLVTRDGSPGTVI